MIGLSDSEWQSFMLEQYRVDQFMPRIVVNAVKKEKGSYEKRGSARIRGSEYAEYRNAQRKKKSVENIKLSFGWQQCLGK